MTPKREFDHDVKLDVEARVRQGVKAVLEEVLEEEMTQHLEVPRDREGEFVTEPLERYKQMPGDVEDAVLEMYLSGISVRKIAGVTEAQRLPC